MKFTIPGEPVGKGRARFTRSGHAYTPQKTRDYEKLVGECFKGKMIEKPKPIRVEIDAWFSIPKSVSNKQRMTMYGSPHTKKPDASNVCKAIEDGLNGIAYEDDSQITDLIVNKRYVMKDEEPRVEVEIKEL